VEQVMSKDQPISFTASKTVRSMAPMSPIICEKGDLVEIDHWVCKEGPTVIKVTSKRYGNAESRCVPFGWVKEMGMPPEMKKLIKVG
jgi:hypothetical protein